MAEKFLDCIEINPKTPATHVVIWLHGLGADGHDFEAIVPELELPEELAVRYVFPHAPMRPVTINAGMVMRAWYDIVELARKVDTDGVYASAALLRALVQRELDRGIASDHIVLAGFSQGGAIVLHTGLRYDKPLAGILALSTYSPTINTLAQERSTANLKIPIMMAHGRHDPVIPLSAATAAHKALADLQYAVQWHEYPMAHQVCTEEIREIRAWLVGIMP
jgi:phospholipase/carboxylesterase